MGERDDSNGGALREIDNRLNVHAEQIAALQTMIAAMQAKSLELILWLVGVLAAFFTIFFVVIYYFAFSPISAKQDTATAEREKTEQLLTIIQERQNETMKKLDAHIAQDAGQGSKD